MRGRKGKARHGARTAPPGYITIEEWGRQTRRGRTAAYAAVRRGEVPCETHGIRVIRADWREQLRRIAEAEAVERKRQHSAELHRNRTEQEKRIDT
jgi:hypothetical protein